MKALLRSFALIIIVVLLIVFLQLRTGIPETDALLQATLEESDPSLGDAGAYAKHHGVSVDEASQRFRIMDSAGLLQADLAANEAETFGGLWIEHSPDFRVVVLITGDAEEPIQPYLTKDYMTKELADVLDVRTANVSLGELERVHAELLSDLPALRICFDSELNVIENTIRLAIGEADKRTFDLAVQNGEIVIPDYMVVSTIPTLSKIEPSLGDHFPQLTNPVGGLDTPAFEGVLALQSGCLRLSEVKDLFPGDNFLLIWDERFSTRTEQGVVQVIDSSTGEIFASVGDHVAIGNGGNILHPTKKPIPAEYPGPYLVVGESIKKIERP